MKKKIQNAEDLVFNADHEVLWAVSERINRYTKAMSKNNYNPPTDEQLMRAIKLVKHNELHFRKPNSKKRKYLSPDEVRPADCDDLLN